MRLVVAAAPSLSLALFQYFLNPEPGYFILLFV